MKKTWHKLDSRNKFFFVLSILGLAHFAFTSLLWLFFAVVSLIQSPFFRLVHFLPSLISFILLFFFIYTTRLIAKQKKFAVTVLLTTIALTCILFFFETRFIGHQVQLNWDGDFVRYHLNWVFCPKIIHN